MKINIFRDDLTDISAKKEKLITIHLTASYMHYVDINTKTHLVVAFRSVGFAFTPLF